MNNACEQWPRGAHDARAFECRNLGIRTEPHRHTRLQLAGWVLDYDDARIRAVMARYAMGDRSWDIRCRTKAKRAGNRKR